MRFGPADGPVVVAAPALFEEGNRTRAFLVRILRLLGRRGIGSVLPDLPGQGESVVPTEQARLSDWHAAFRAAGRHATVVLAIRGGALADGLALPCWRLSPLTGPEQARELDRIRLSAGRVADTDPVEIAGNRLSRALLAEFAVARLRDAPALRTVRLQGDPRPADRHVPGRPLWRASEPDVDEALAATLADDIAAWVRTCAA